MSNLTEESSLNTNRFLAELQDWNEDEVYKYKSKVNGQIAFGYFVMVLGYFFSMLVGSLVVGFLYAFVIELSFGKYLQLLITGLQFFITYLVFESYGRKKTAKFIKENHGEVGHAGHRYRRALVLNKWISLIISLGYTAYMIYTQVASEGWGSLLESFSSVVMLTAAPFATFFFFIGAEMETYGETCPVCGRHGTVEKVELKSYGDKVDGTYSVKSTSREEVGTERTTTYWSDGSTTSKDSPIYGNVTHVRVYDKHSNLADYVVTCRECTYHATGTEKQNYDVKVDEYSYRG